MTLFLTTAEVVPDVAAWDWNTAISGSVGAAVMGLLIFVVKLVLDRAIPSRSDNRASVTLVLEGLQNMVKVLQEEKLADSEVLKTKQARINTLEADAEADYNTIQDLRKEVTDLNSRLALRDRNIKMLISELQKLGATVSGIDLEALDTTQLKVTMV